MLEVDFVEGNRGTAVEKKKKKQGEEGFLVFWKEKNYSNLPDCLPRIPVQESPL